MKISNEEETFRKDTVCLNSGREWMGVFKFAFRCHQGKHTGPNRVWAPENLVRKSRIRFMILGDGVFPFRTGGFHRLLNQAAKQFKSGEVFLIKLWRLPLCYQRQTWLKTNRCKCLRAGWVFFRQESPRSLTSFSLPLVKVGEKALRILFHCSSTTTVMAVSRFPFRPKSWIRWNSKKIKNRNASCCSSQSFLFNLLSS